MRNARKIVGYMMLGMVGALMLTLGARSVMLWQVQKGVEEDLAISAQLMLERASDATQTAVDLLNRLAQSSGLSCTPDHRFLYSEATRSTAWVDTIGLVDRNGNLVCTDLGQSSRQAGLLPGYHANDEQVTLSLSGGRESQGRSCTLLVIRHVTNGRRLIARVPGELIRVDPVRHELRPFRFAMLSLGSNNPWYIQEPTEIGGDISIRLHRTCRTVDAFEVNISVSDLALEVVTQGYAEDHQCVRSNHGIALHARRLFPRTVPPK